MRRSLLEKLILATVPITLFGSLMVAWLISAWSGGDSLAAGGPFSLRLLAPALAGGALTAAILSLAGWVVLRPARALVREVGRVARGEGSRTVSFRGGSELDEIARSINAISAAAAGQRRELFYLNQAIQEISEAEDLDALGNAAAEVLLRFIPSRYILVTRFDGELVRTLAFRDGASGGGAPPDLGREDPIRRKAWENPSAFVISRRELPGGSSAMPGEEILVASSRIEGLEEGILCILSDPKEGSYGAPDIDRAEFIAGTVAGQLRSILIAERRLEEVALEVELETAELVQRTLFPREDLKLPAFTACGHYTSASKTCGDWYGYIHDPDRNRVVVMIGDVTGHGVPAALVASAANSFVRTIDQIKSTFYDLEVVVRQVRREIESVAGVDLETADCDPLNPARLLEYLNSNILATVERALGMTFFASTFDLQLRELRCACAGHEPPLVYRAAGIAHQPSRKRETHVECLPGGGVRLGDMPNPSFQVSRIQLEPGDVILYYTDGLTDLRDGGGEEFGSKRLIQLLDGLGSGEPEEIRERIIEAIEEFRGDVPLTDDLSFVVAKYRG